MLSGTLAATLMQLLSFQRSLFLLLLQTRHLFSTRSKIYDAVFYIIVNSYYWYHFLQKFFILDIQQIFTLCIFLSVAVLYLKQYRTSMMELFHINSYQLKVVITTNCAFVWVKSWNETCSSIWWVRTFFTPTSHHPVSQSIGRSVGRSVGWSVRQSVSQSVSCW